MSTLTWAKVALAVIGVLIWAYGVRVDERPITWIGIGFLVAAFLLRFVGRQRPPAP